MNTETEGLKSTTYVVDYGDGALAVIDGAYYTLDEVKNLVDAQLKCTYGDVVIMDENGDLLAWRIWYDAPCDDEVIREAAVVNPITFGDIGFYGDWVDYN